MSRKSRLRRQQKQPFLPMLRFYVDDRGVSYPLELGLGENVSEDPSHHGLPRTEIVGVDPESLADAAASGDLTDFRLPDGQEVFAYHLLVERFEYELAPIPTLTLVLPSCSEGGRSARLRFSDAVISDWATDRDYLPEDPNNELCEFRWDGWRNFLLES